MCAKKAIRKDKVQLEFVVCHRRPDRSFFWKGKQFPVCARCTGINIGYISIFFFVTNVLYFNWLWTFLLMLPTTIDGLIQAYWNIESTNTRRVVTGFITGVGIMSFVNIIGDAAGKQILVWIR
jgi:uncharacterized membrane protein